jgi:ATP-dependent exoDNAse (exonuclease V) alpha subunit
MAASRIGTVDKFQGQEAEVVIVSMATSGADDMPRDASFLLARNRLNVAISRARCLAVLLASPSLLDLVANSVAEMRLANLFCWAAEFSGACTRSA